MIATSILGFTDINLGEGDSKTSTTVKNSEGSGMKTDQAEKLDDLLNQSTRVLSKNN